MLDIDTPVPSGLTHPRFVATPLTAEVAELDHAAYRVVEAFAPTSAMVTFWVRQDHQDTGLAEAVAEATNDWLVNEWPLATHLFRILPAELASRRALERQRLTRVRLTEPYLWYRPA